MNIEILYRPSYSLGRIQLGSGEQVRVEGGAMVGMSPGVTLETAATGGFLKSLGRALLGGESFFQNTYQTGASGGEITVAPPLPGDLVGVGTCRKVLGLGHVLLRVDGNFARLDVFRVRRSKR